VQPFEAAGRRLVRQPLGSRLAARCFRQGMPLPARGRFGPPRSLGGHVAAEPFEIARVSLPGARPNAPSPPGSDPLRRYWGLIYHGHARTRAHAQARAPRSRARLTNGSNEDGAGRRLRTSATPHTAHKELIALTHACCSCVALRSRAVTHTSRFEGRGGTPGPRKTAGRPVQSRPAELHANRSTGGRGREARLAVRVAVSHWKDDDPRQLKRRGVGKLA
jgi:hypothetical protein